MPRAALLTCLVLLALPAAAAGQVLVVGDSLELGTAPYLRGELRGVTALAVDARSGRASGEGLRVLRATLSPADDVVVFDLGTNDTSPAVLAADLAAAATAIGDRCLVVASIVRPRLGGPLTAVVDSFASARPNVRVVPWRETVAGSRGVIRRDGVHATPRGYALRARLVAQTVESCLAGPGAPGASQTGAPIPAPPLAPPEPKFTPRPTPAPPPTPRSTPRRPRPPGPTGFHPEDYDRFASLLGTLAVGAVLGPPDDGLRIVTR